MDINLIGIYINIMIHHYYGHGEISLIHSGIIEFILSISLLYMFCTGLYKIYKISLEQHINEYELENINQNVTESISLSSTSQCERESIRRIIKKQPILIFIALSSSFLYWSISAFEPNMSLQ